MILLAKMFNFSSNSYILRDDFYVSFRDYVQNSELLVIHFNPKLITENFHIC